ncbi:Rrf2 family transcriptional regulator [Methylopila musalis]|uniref:Rrf2 family transcriptional regulator n=1 Tax=Methylopila musalis TaxID=1134781 RepID=A0ABW3Z4R5_9HYPH
MRLTRYTDYSIRTLIYLAARPEKLSSIAEIATAYDISQNHLMKVVHELGKAGYVETLRGRSGGVRLARAPETITIGEVVRRMEDGFDLVDCPSCPINGACGVQGLLAEATAAFLAVLDRRTLASVTGGPSGLRAVLAALKTPRTLAAASGCEREAVPDDVAG